MLQLLHFMCNASLIRPSPSSPKDSSHKTLLASLHLSLELLDLPKTYEISPKTPFVFPPFTHPTEFDRPPLFGKSPKIPFVFPPLTHPTKFDLSPLFGKSPKTPCVFPPFTHPTEFDLSPLFGKSPKTKSEFPCTFPSTGMFPTLWLVDL